MATIDDYNKLVAEKKLRDGKLIKNIIIGVCGFIALILV